MKKVLVTYYDGVQRNASTKSAKLTALGLRVKEMLDSMTGWKTEGYPVEETTGTAYSSNNTIVEKISPITRSKTNTIQSISCLAEQDVQSANRTVTPYPSTSADYNSSESAAIRNAKASYQALRAMQQGKGIGRQGAVC